MEPATAKTLCQSRDLDRQRRVKSFSVSAVGFGIIINYASYLKQNDDVASAV